MAGAVARCPRRGRDRLTGRPTDVSKIAISMRLVASRCALRVILDASRRVAPSRTHFLFPAMADQKKAVMNMHRTDPGHDRSPAFRTRRPHRAPDRRPRSSGVLDRMDWVAPVNGIGKRNYECAHIRTPGVRPFFLSCLTVLSIIIDTYDTGQAELSNRRVKDNVARPTILTLRRTSSGARSARSREHVFTRETFA